MRIGISGAQSVGKTTLLNALRSEKCFANYEICNEVTRRVGSYGLPINEYGGDITQRLIMQEHIVNVFMNDNMITDRTSLDGLVYTTWLWNNKKVSYETHAHALAVYRKVQPMYDVQFYIKPEFDIEDDGVRSLDLSFRDAIVDIFNQTIKQQQTNIVVIHGSVRERVEQVLKHIGEIK